jgi:hypothetical protein
MSVNITKKTNVETPAIQFRIRIMVASERVTVE